MRVSRKYEQNEESWSQWESVWHSSHQLSSLQAEGSVIVSHASLHTFAASQRDAQIASDIVFRDLVEKRGVRWPG